MKKLGCVLSVVFSLFLLVGCSNYVDPPKKFLDSKIVTPMGMNNFPFGEISVKEFVDKLSKKQLDNGKYPEIKGWTNSDNIYTLHAVLKDKEFKVNFAHILSKEQGDGAYSGMSGTIDGQEFPGIEVMKFIMF